MHAVNIPVRPLRRPESSATREKSWDEQRSKQRRTGCICPFHLLKHAVTERLALIAPFYIVYQEQNDAPTRMTPTAATTAFSKARLAPSGAQVNG